MALVEWQDRFRIGIESVDHEHREMIELLNDLHGRLQSGAELSEVEDFLGEVNATISAHFALEERIMRDRGYDRFAEHKADHEALLEEIRDLMDDCARFGGDDILAGLGPRLEAWFGNHFRSHDARLHALLDTSGGRGRSG